MDKKNRKILIRLIISGIIIVGALFVEIFGLKLAMFLAAYAFAGYDVLFRAVRNISHGQVFDENFLMCVATVGAFCIGEYMEGVAVMIFYQVGEMFQRIAVANSRKSIAALMDIMPDEANVEKDGKVERVDASEVAVGDIIIVNPGEKVPVDGAIISGSCYADTKAITGEPFPRKLDEGDEITSGFIVNDSPIKMRAEKAYDDSAVAKILEMVENASERKAKTQDFISKFAKVYTPIVVFAALAVAVIPSIITGDVSQWVQNALIFLVVSCPCALVISIPIAFFGGIGAASKQGILIKGGNYLEVLSKVNTVLFDKTGTLTKGQFGISAIEASGISESELLEYAAMAEVHSNHPIAKCIVKAYGKQIEIDEILDAKEISGRGTTAVYKGKTILAGSRKFMAENFVELPCEEDGRQTVYVAVDGKYAGRIMIADTIKDGAKETISLLKKSGIKTVMLTGDIEATAQSVSNELGIDEHKSGLMPLGKLSELEKIQQDNSRIVAFAGDGINDAPVLMRADVGIAMGALGSDAAIEAADVVIMNDDIRNIYSAIKTSKRTLNTAWQNIIIAIGVKVAVMALSVLGIGNMWEAVFADVGVCVIAVLNAAKLLKIKE